jgi:flagellar basal body-associated protein FliL
MAEKAEKKAEASDKKDKDAGKGAAAPAAAPAAEGEAKSGGGIGALLAKTPVILGAVMLIEAIVLFAGFKFIAGGPKNANADLTTELKKDSADATTAESEQTVEIQLLDDKFPNRLSGRTFLYDVAISLSVKGQYADKVKKGISDHDALIKDRVRTIIAELDPEKLGGGSEPGLETLRRQVKYQLDEIIGDGMVDEVLVPKCLSFRTDY